jgi:molybdenum cofactor cytidylyltransferase
MERPDDVAAVILAAGESRRFGSPKQLALLEGRTLLEHVLEAARLAELRPVVAVVPVWLTRPASAAGADELVWVRNPDPARGMSHSLRLGLAAVPPSAGAALVLLGDEPRVSVAHLRALVAARGSRPIVATDRDGLLAPPVLLERSAFGSVATLTGDIGLRELIRRDPGQVATVAIGPVADVDTPDDLRVLRDE